MDTLMRELRAVRAMLAMFLGRLRRAADALPVDAADPRARLAQAGDSLETAHAALSLAMQYLRGDADADERRIRDDRQ